MTVIGFNLKKILVERKGFVRGEVKVNTRMNIVSVKKEKTKIMPGKDVLGFDFEFIISYNSVSDSKSDIAELVFEGNTLYLTDPKEGKKIIENWEKKKQIPEDINIKVLNTVLSKCNVKALVLEDDIGLPPHLPLPKFGKNKEEDKNKSYTG